MTKTTLLTLLVLGLVLAPAAEARTTDVKNCNGQKLTFDSDDQSYTDSDGKQYKANAQGEYPDPPVDLCAKGQAGFMKLVYTIQTWGAVIAIMAIAAFGMMFMFSGGNQQKRAVATGGLVGCGVALLLLIFAVDIVNAFQNMF
jgi:hypothetical protein